MAGCDGCTACCKIMGVRELDKPADRWCRHCNIGEGCATYDSRPWSCRVFECVWLQTQSGNRPLARDLRPDVSGVVISTANGGEEIVLNVSADRANAWKKGAVRKLVTDMLADGIAVMVKCGEDIKRVRGL